MTSKMHRRKFLKGSLGVLAAGQSASLLTPAQPARATAAQQPRTAAGSPTLFPGFRTQRFETTGATIHTVVGGSGPPLLLLHGHPQTHVMWHKVAPRLAGRFSIVAADLRGYGDSSKPPDGQNHAGYSKRAMGQDMAEVMTQLGFDRFVLVGHDRGARVATRMALDYPQRVTKLAVFDNLPTLMMYRNLSKDLVTTIHHWFFLIQPSPYPETMIANSLELYLGRSFGRAPRGTFPDEAYAEYLRCFRNPATIHAACEDYRAGASIDLEHDEADWNQKITCPLLALWAERGTVARFFGNVLDRWKEKAVDVRGKPMPSGHHIPEELPDEVLAELNSFLPAA